MPKGFQRIGGELVQGIPRLACDPYITAVSWEMTVREEGTVLTHSILGYIQYLYRDDFQSLLCNQH